MRLIESEVIGIICDRLKKVGELNPTSAKQLAVLTKDYNADMQEIQKAIRKRMNLSVEEVDRIFRQAAQDSTELATALAMDRLNVVDTRRVEEQARAAAARYKDRILNLSDTFAFKMGEGYKPLREAYIAVTNKATLAVHSGALDYNTAIRQEVKRLADHGISVVEWESGYHRRLDSSVRMNVMEGVRQMNQEILEEAGEKFATGYEISAHDRPAPDHADIQGRQYTKEEYEKLNASLKRPIGTLNCMHIAYPIIYGVTKPTYSEKELEEMKEHAEKKYSWKGKELTGYECTQEQRRMETEIRKSQDKERALRRAGDNTGADLEKEKTQALRKEYKEFSRHVGLSEKLNRTGRAGKPSKPKVLKQINMPVVGEQLKITGSPLKQITARYWDVSEEYERNAKPGEGQWFEEEGFVAQEDDQKQLEETADVVIRKYGGNIEFLAADAPKGEPNPDWLWREKLWDVKCPTSVNALKQRLGKGIHQIKDNPGGVILNLYDWEISKYDVWRAINGRMKQVNCQYDVDIMVIMKNKVTMMLRYAKSR